MESLIYLGSQSPKDKHPNNINNTTSPSIHLLEGLNIHGQTLRDLPIPAATTSVRAAPSRSVENRNRNGPEATGLPARLGLPNPDPIHTLRNMATTTDRNARGSDKAQANFFFSHTLEVASGVIEAVHKELTRARGGHGIEIRKTREGSYLRITAPSKDIGEVISAAQSVADELISNESSWESGIFQEPPITVNSASQVVLDIDTQLGEVRPKLQIGKGVSDIAEVAGDFHEYVTKLSNRVYAGLKKAGRIPPSLKLRAHLGYCLLRTYPQDKIVYEYRDYCVMMKNPRASAWFKTSVGNETLAVRLLDFIRNDAKSPFLPTEARLGSPANVLPEYAFEARSQTMKFMMDIREGNRAKAGGRTLCRLARLMTSKVDANFAEVDIINQSLGRNLDWKLEAIHEDRGGKTFQEVEKYLGTASIELIDSDRPHDLNVYPHVKLNPHDSAAAKIKHVAVKTLYRFRWKETSYVVEVAVNHRWSSISAMTAGKPSTVDVGISIFGQDWDSEDEAAGNIWGDELQYLLEDTNSHTTSGGIDRVGHFIQMIRDIRNALDPII
ncbi:hypothetical protein F5B19DRAFT_489980 [Rostrohypoxylon terebratum]|nr:hypothetical protein F5B19DRAFT_489980 [Rostrohypoxylon terebratum]